MVPLCVVTEKFCNAAALGEVSYEVVSAVVCISLIATEGSRQKNQKSGHTTRSLGSSRRTRDTKQKQLQASIYQ